MALLSIIFAGVTALGPLGLLGTEPVTAYPELAQELAPVKFAQLQIEPEKSGVDLRIDRGRRALAEAYPTADLTILVSVKYGLNQIDLFDLASTEFVSELGGTRVWKTPTLTLGVQSLVQEKQDDGETETFALTLKEGSKIIASSRTTVNCQGRNVKDVTTDSPSGCLVDAATADEMFGRLADKISSKI